MANEPTKTRGGRRRGRVLGALARRPVTIAVAALLGVALTAGCSSSSDDSGGSDGTVNVLYAGSMVGMMKDVVGPAFEEATGNTFSGFTGGDKDVASQIEAGVHAGDIFMSAAVDVNNTLMGPDNGDLISWYATYATSPLVIGYNPDSEFADDLTSKPWYEVITEPGLRIGFSDPATDPKGEKAVQAMNHAASVHNLPELEELATDTSSMFPEDTLVGRLQSGQLDAAYFYASEATAANIQTVPVTGEDLGATYTIAILNKGPHQDGAQEFVSYLLGTDGLDLLRQNDFQLITPPQITGSDIPDSLKDVLGQ